jgi:hypothetical protein
VRRLCGIELEVEVPEDAFAFPGFREGVVRHAPDHTAPQTAAKSDLQVLILLIELALNVLIPLAELVLTVRILLIGLALTVLILLAELVPTVRILLTERVLTVLILLTELVS